MLLIKYMPGGISVTDFAAKDYVDMYIGENLDEIFSKEQKLEIVVSTERLLNELFVSLFEEYLTYSSNEKKKEFADYVVFVVSDMSKHPAVVLGDYIASHIELILEPILRNDPHFFDDFEDNEFFTRLLNKKEKERERELDKFNINEKNSEIMMNIINEKDYLLKEYNKIDNINKNENLYY